MRSALPVLLLVLLITLLTAAGPARAADQVSVTPDREQLATAVGGRFTLRTTLAAGDRATGPLLAHLNVVSLSPDVYVDPEDWSTERSQWVDPLQPQGEVRLSWPMQAVNVGSFDVYVVLLPADPESGAVLTVSPPVHLSVSSRQTISPGGVLPVVLGVPAVLGLLVAGRLRSRSRSGPRLQRAVTS